MDGTDRVLRTSRDNVGDDPVPVANRLSHADQRSHSVFDHIAGRIHCSFDHVADRIYSHLPAALPRRLVTRPLWMVGRYL
jgi:hypothetical protein